MAKVLVSCGCGGVGPLIGSKRSPTLCIVFGIKHASRNLDELEFGIRYDCDTSCHNLYVATEGTVTGVHVTGVDRGHNHSCGEPTCEFPVWTE